MCPLAFMTRNPLHSVPGAVGSAPLVLRMPMDRLNMLIQRCRVSGELSTRPVEEISHNRNQGLDFDFVLFLLFELMVEVRGSATLK